MKIAVMGMGVAGSYLLSRLKGDHDVVGYERMQKERHDSICAWGTCKSRMEELCQMSGIDFSRYVEHDGKKMHVEMAGQKEFGIGLHGLCTYDKISLIKDMTQSCDVRYGQSPKKADLEAEYDLILDCTGFHRCYLPKVKDDFFLPTYEYKIEYEAGKRPYDDFFIRPFPGMSGYFWYFPLGERRAHIGAGDYNKGHIRVTDEFLKRHGGTVTKTVGRPIRLATPDMCRPFSDGKVVGVGESIGTVFPLLGEGIIPSMECADIFVRNMHDIAAYEKKVDEFFRIYGTVHRFVRAKIRGTFGPVRGLPDMLAIFRYMKKNESRFGMEIHMRDLIKVARA